MNEKEQRKLEKLEKKIQKKQKRAQFLEELNSILSESNKNKQSSYDSFWTEQEKDLMENEGYEPYQFEEEELEDDDLYEGGED